MAPCWAARLRTHVATIINIDVPDVRQAVDFYTSAVDTVLERYIDEDVAELSAGLVKIYLLKQPQDSRPNPTPGSRRDYRRHWTPVHLDFVVADLDAAVKKAEAAGAYRETDRTTWRGATHVSFRDPFGHGFCLISFDGDTYD